MENQWPIIRETRFSSVPPSNSLVLVSEPWRVFGTDLAPLLPEQGHHQARRSQDDCMCCHPAGLGGGAGAGWKNYVPLQYPGGSTIAMGGATKLGGSTRHNRFAITLKSRAAAVQQLLSWKAKTNRQEIWYKLVLFLHWNNKKCQKMMFDKIHFLKVGEPKQVIFDTLLTLLVTAKQGEILWKNQLQRVKSWGFGEITFALCGSSSENIT